MMVRDPRTLVHYQRMLKLIDAVSLDTVEARARAVFDLMDDMNAFHFEWLSISAERSLNLALDDREAGVA